MEEKERYELFGEHCIKDNNPDARPQLLDAYVACVILNEQDKKIKAKEKEANTYAKEIVFLDNKIKLLKQGQKQLAIDKMTELYNLTDEIYHSNDMDKEWLLDWLKAEIWKLNQEIKSLKGE